jgi:histidine ammonia-lyase
MLSYALRMKVTTSSLITLGDRELTFRDVLSVARHSAPVEISRDATLRMESMRVLVDQAAEGRTPYYGINTGVGSLASSSIGKEAMQQAQQALVVSHSAGCGGFLPRERVRAAMLLRANTFCRGSSGVRPEIAERLVRFLNEGLTPQVQQFGSLGCSGDLAQLAQLAAAACLGYGSVADSSGNVVEAEAALKSRGMAPMTLEAKEGLSLINGTEFMLGSLCVDLLDLVALVATADSIAALTAVSQFANPDAFGSSAMDLRPHEGQAVSAANLRTVVGGLDLPKLRADSGHVREPQDAYSIRCTPQVHGAFAEVLVFASRVCKQELRSVTDNPAVVASPDSPDGLRIVSHGNFHGQPLAFVADFLAIALADLASISERRTNRLVDEKLSRGLPPFLSPGAGANSGLMIPHYTAAALVNRLRTLAAPASVDSVPTSAGQEDHVSMGWNACLKLSESIWCVQQVLAIELIASVQAVEMRRIDISPSAPVRELIRRTREVVPALDEDRYMADDLRSAVELVRAGGALAHGTEARYATLLGISGQVVLP